MKANEVPEKIFLFENLVTETLDDRWLSKRSGDTDIEYARTDAFIEKACEWLRYNNNLIDGDVDDYVDDFKNYMKEE